MDHLIAPMIALHHVKFGQLWTSNRGDYEDRNFNFLNDMQKSAYCPNISEFADLHQIFSDGRHIGEHDQSDIRFAVARGTLLC